MAGSATEFLHPTPSYGIVTRPPQTGLAAPVVERHEVGKPRTTPDSQERKCLDRRGRMAKTSDHFAHWGRDVSPARRDQHPAMRGSQCWILQTSHAAATAASAAAAPEPGSTKFRNTLSIRPHGRGVHTVY